MIERTLLSLLRETLDVDRKMAFVSGPRQVGKTTLARQYQHRVPQSRYFNWDAVPDQKQLLKDPYFFEKENRNPAQPFLVIFDEIHKYARWKNYLKGAYDQFHEEFRFLVTGSGRNSSASTSENIAVLTPTPSPSDNIATAKKPGLRRMLRHA